MRATDLSSFGELLRAFRRRRRFTQAQLAGAVGVHRTAIIRWELGDFLPESKAVVLELARHLHLDDQESCQLLEASLTALTPYWDVSLPRNPFFTGREEILKRLHMHLGIDQAGARINSIALQGLGGIGKTQIALEYAYRYALEYRAVFWLAAETVETLTFSFLRIAEVLQAPECREADPQRVIASVQRWLATHSQWLLIWDNLEDLDLLVRFLPSARQGAMLLTTRCQTLGTLAQGIDLAPMEPEEGLLFLLRRAKVLEPTAASADVRQLALEQPAQYQAAAELVSGMGGLPLALDQTGAYLEATCCGLPAYLELFHTQRAALLQQRGEGVQAHPASVWATFTLALAAITQRHPAVGDLLRVCALLQAEAIPEELFRQGAEHLGTHLQSICRDPLEWNRVVASACAYSLVSRQPEGQTLAIHRLVQAILVDTMTKAEQEQWNRRAIEALDAVFPEMQPLPEQTTWKQCERLLPHALLCLHRGSAVDESLIFASLAVKTAQYLRARGQYAEVESLLLCALQIREQALGPDHLEVALLFNLLAILYVEQGKYEQAKPFYLRALQIREQVLGPEHALVAVTLNNLALLCWTQGKYKEAEEFFYRALHILEQTLTPDDDRRAFLLNNLAHLYRDQGRASEAEGLYQQVLEQWEQSLGPAASILAEPLTGLARIRQEQGRAGEAEGLYRRALSLREQALGSDHPEVVYSLTGLTSLCRDQGRVAEAEFFCQRALSIWEHQFGPDHPGMAYMLNDLANLCRDQGRDAKAGPLYRRALRIREQALGGTHPLVAIPLRGLANLWRDQGDDAQAAALYQRALSIQEQHLGQLHPETAQTLHDLVVFHQKQGKRSEARTLAARALAIRLQSLGETHPKTQATRALHAQLIQEQPGRDVEASASDEDDPLSGFLDACCELHPLAWCRIRDLWQTYEHWAAIVQKCVPLSRRTFAVQLKARGCRVDRTSTARIWRGIRLVKTTG